MNELLANRLLLERSVEISIEDTRSAVQIVQELGIVATQNQEEQDIIDTNE